MHTGIPDPPLGRIRIAPLALYVERSLVAQIRPGLLMTGMSAVYYCRKMEISCDFIKECCKILHVSTAVWV
jgi:hypothetical protein